MENEMKEFGPIKRIKYLRDREPCYIERKK